MCIRDSPTGICFLLFMFKNKTRRGDPKWSSAVGAVRCKWQNKSKAGSGRAHGPVPTGICFLLFMFKNKTRRGDPKWSPAVGPKRCKRQNNQKPAADGHMGPS